MNRQIRSIITRCLMLICGLFAALDAQGHLTCFDDLHRLTAVNRPSGQVSFNYDSIGNIITNGEALSGAYVYTCTNNRLPHAVKIANGKTYAYDANGNMLMRGSQHLEYDPENHLVLARTTNSTTTFGYAADGARLWKQTSTTNGLQVWIGNTYEEKNGKILYHIYAGGTLVCTLDSAGTVADYYQSDDLHSTSILTDSGGNLSQHYEYSAYGRDRYTYSSSAFPVSRRFTSQVKDDETGLYYYGARYYDPELGRFIQPDSIIPDPLNPQSLNRYSYCLNNPLRFTDPTGHQEAEPAPRGEITEELQLELRAGRADLARQGRLPLEVRFEIAAERQADLRASETYARSRGFSTTEPTLSAPETPPNPAMVGRLDPEMLKIPTVDLALKYKPGWSAAQRAAADAKAAVLTEADTTVVKTPERGGTTQSRYRKEAGLDSTMDADHKVDLQLGGKDVKENMSGLDKSVNRSLGSQIQKQIKNLPEGTKINNVKMQDQ